MSDALSKMELMGQSRPVLAVDNSEAMSGRADWTDLLQSDRGRRESHIYNCEIALENAPALAGKIRLNSFAEQVEAVDDLPWDRSSPSGKVERQGHHRVPVLAKPARHEALQGDRVRCDGLGRPKEPLPSGAGLLEDESVPNGTGFRGLRPNFWTLWASRRPASVPQR